MSDLAIRVEGLSKRYRIGARQRSYQTLRDRLTDAITSPFRHLRSTFRPSTLQPVNENAIWALKDVSFEVKHGEVVGVIGRNGAGKSTLLKILSRITGPTAGQVEVYGRVGSLLEVGTGFHPELTGRENIYLNGAILGMRKAETERRFDEIVAFAEVEKFLDTPVRHYSSGMYVRLAFAVAAHLEPEILLVDEVLAVGDAAFQKKCLGKMGEVAKGGRTVLFVSHNMPAVSALTGRALVLEQGSVAYCGDTQEAIGSYGKTILGAQHTGFFPRGRTGSGRSRILNATIADSGRQETSTIEFTRPFYISINYETDRSTGILAGFTIVSSLGAEILTSHSDDTDTSPLKGRGKVTCCVNPNCLTPGRYYLRLGLFDQTYDMDDRIEQAVDFEVVMTEGKFSSMVDGRPGLIKLPFSWRVDDSGGANSGYPSEAS